MFISSNSLNLDCVIHGAGSSTVKVPEAVPPTEIFFLRLLFWPVVYFLGDLIVGKGTLLAIFVQEK